MEINSQQYERCPTVLRAEKVKEHTVEHGSAAITDKGTVKAAAEEKAKSSNISVYVRVRPLTKDEIIGGEKACVQVMEDARFIKVVDYGYGYNTLSRTFQFDGCLGPETVQVKVMEKCKMKMLLDSVLEGYSAAVMASGQTGSGKTYTMCGRHEGRSADCGKDDGLIARSVDYLFSEIRKRNKGNEQKPYSLKASYYEIYNEQVNDLLRLDCAPREVRWSIKDGFYVDNLLLVECESVEDVFAVLHEGAKNKKVGSHDLNKDSSRSHCIMTLHVNSTSWFGEGPPIVKYGKMLFVDLAGSERLKKSKSSGEMLRETGNINRSLFTLGKVISALSEGKRDDLVPYRESLLTKLLMDSLGGSSLALMIACISPASSAVDETLSTLCYATCTKTIVNMPSVNMDPRDEEDAERIEDDGFEEITNLTNWSHSLPNFEIAHAFSDRFSKGQTVNSGKIHRGGSDELSGLTGKQNETIGYYRGLESTKSKGLQPFIRRNRVSVDHLSPRVKSKVSPKTQSIKSGIKDNGFQGSITVNQNAFFRLLDINSSEDDLDVFNY